MSYLQLVHKIRLTTLCVSAEIISSFLCVYLDGDDDDDSDEFFEVVNQPFPQLEHLKKYLKHRKNNNKNNTYNDN